MTIDEPILRSALVALAEQCKQQYMELTAAIEEIEAVQKAMQQLEPRYKEVLEHQKTLHKTVQLRAGAI